MIFGGYNPDRHEYDPLLKAWLYGGPTAPCFWLPHNIELAKSWCEHIGYSRLDGILRMIAHAATKPDRWHDDILVNHKTWHPNEYEMHDCEQWIRDTANLSFEEMAEFKTRPTFDMGSLTKQKLADAGVVVEVNGKNILENDNPEDDVKIVPSKDKTKLTLVTKENENEFSNNEDFKKLQGTKEFQKLMRDISVKTTQLKHVEDDD